RGALPRARGSRCAEHPHRADPVPRRSPRGPLRPRCRRAGTGRSRGARVPPDRDAQRRTGARTRARERRAPGCFICKRADTPCMAALPSGTVTLLFTDIEGSTRLVHDLGERYPEILAAHRRALRGAVTEHGGVAVRPQGAAFFLP